MGKQKPLDWRLQGGPGEVMAFLKEQLKAAHQVGTYLTVAQIGESWRAHKGGVSIVPEQLARLHTLFNQRLVKLLKRGLAIRQEDYARTRGQPSYGWRWDPTGIDLSEEY